MDHTFAASGCAGIWQHAGRAGIRDEPEHLEQQIANPLQSLVTSGDTIDA